LLGDACLCASNDIYAEKASEKYPGRKKFLPRPICSPPDLLPDLLPARSGLTPLLCVAL